MRLSFKTRNASERSNKRKVIRLRSNANATILSVAIFSFCFLVALFIQGIHNDRRELVCGGMDYPCTYPTTNEFANNVVIAGMIIAAFVWVLFSLTYEEERPVNDSDSG